MLPGSGELISEYGYRVWLDGLAHAWAGRFRFMQANLQGLISFLRKSGRNEAGESTREAEGVHYCVKDVSLV